MIKDLRVAQRHSQADLARLLTEASGTPIGRERISRWERGDGGVIPNEFWLRHLAQCLSAPYPALEYEAKVSRMDRRNFMRLTALTATHGTLARDLVSSIAGSDSGPLTTTQTTHGTDLVIASLADAQCRTKLSAWMQGASNPVLRVNAAGILAKIPGQDRAQDVCRVLNSDIEVRNLYTVAVITRVSGMTWTEAQRLAADPLCMPDKATFLAGRFAEEARNPRDAGARWCSATMLRDISPLIGKETQGARI